MVQLFIENLWLFWLIASTAMLILELTSGDFYLVCFAAGAVVALVCALFPSPFWLQVLVWVVASLLCVVFVRPPLVRKLHAGEENRISNADALIGKRGTVTETVKAGGHGYVKIDGDEWRSVSTDGQEIPEGTPVTVVARDSIILTVEK